MALISPPGTAVPILPMSVGVSAGPTVVFLRGEHDRANAERTWEVLSGSAASSKDDLVVDLGEVSFMDASTVGLIARLHAEMVNDRRDLVLRSPSGIALRVLDICGLAHLVEAVGDHRSVVAWSGPSRLRCDGGQPGPSGGLGDR